MADADEQPEAPEAPSQNDEEEQEDELNTENDATLSPSDMGFEEEDIPEDLFSRLGTSSDNEEQKRLYLEYNELIKEISHQNQMIAQIKCQIRVRCEKPNKTRCEILEIKRMRECMENEILKLECMKQNAVKLQHYGSHRHYRAIPLETTIDEDNIMEYTNCIRPQSLNWNKDSEPEKPCVCRPPPRPESSNNKEDMELKVICQALGKLKVSCPEDKKMVQEIAKALMCGVKKPKPSQQPPCRIPKSLYKTPPKPCKSQSPQAQQQYLPCNDSMDRLKERIGNMQNSVNKLRQEITRREREKKMKERMGNDCEPKQPEAGDCPEEPDAILKCISKRKTKCDEIERLKENYIHLLQEYAKKECTIKEMEKRMKGFCGGCGKNGSEEKKDPSVAELNLLRTRNNELKEEQVEFKCIMQEQSQQLDDYRQKYIDAQQKVEEQAVTLEKLNMSNKRIEKQINNEVKEIRAKFQEKLNELLHFPELLENEQVKLAACCKEKEELQSKLVLICKEVRALRSKAESPKENTDCRPQLAKCKAELSQLKKTFGEVENERNLYCEKVKKLQEDLDTLRCESAKIIARTKERTELIRLQQQQQLDRVERDLAKCRATASLSVCDREAVIREMQGQLNTLSYSFDAAQKQIKTLRNHIAYVSNENTYPMKC